VPNLFSFNSPIGACETCRGFGRTIGIDYDLVIPDKNKTLAEGAIKPWQTASYNESQEDLSRFAKRRGVPLNVPWKEFSDDQKTWVLEGEGSWEDGKWYGVRRFFEWLETRSYRMHIRVLLSRYRAYRTCASCKGARLKPDALLWKLGEKNPLSVHEVMLLPIGKCHTFFSNLALPKPLDKAAEGLMGEITTRLRYLADVGLDYLTLDRQSRTLSGGEVQRINLTTALGTSLVNALFVLDEPSIGLHSRDIGRLINVLHKLRDAGNTLLVVEHDPEVIASADCVIDMGPGPGEKGGDIVFMGPFSGLLKSPGSLTAQ
jgi:excinuclease ABC subunit A